MNNKKVIVFSQPNCPTCKSLISHLTTMNIKFQLVERSSDLELFKKNSIIVSPTTIIYDNEIEVSRFYGLKKEAYIRDVLDEGNQ